MARDKIEVELLLNAKRAEATIKKMNRELDKMGKSMGRAFSGVGSGGAGDKVRALGTGLSKATVRADEFTKSLEASNARVIAFGASAGLIMNIDRAFKAMVKSAIQVEKAMADVNVVMNASTKNLKKFEVGMFKVAKNTAQGFQAVAEAATELARQGLGMEKTLSRTNDALILTRLTGMNAADSVKSLTAAVNSFSKAGVTSTQVINKMAKVDAAFAVSSEDLAKSIARVGSSAVDAGVSLDQLLAITTAVQQKTARGGAVIGNAFKTIFTRIQRTDVQQKLAAINVATRGMNNEMLDAVTVLQNLANKFGTLTKAKQASIAEDVAGVFQVNVLRAALSDLSDEYSNYGRALSQSAQATNEAYKRNEELNKSLDALVNRTLANLTQAGAALGGGAFGPAIENVLGLVNSAIESFGKGGKMEGFGEGLGKTLLTGVGKFISGPGLVFISAVFGKLALSLGKFATQALKDVVGVNTATKQRAALEEIVVATIAKEPALLQKVKTGTLDVLTVEKQILSTIRQQQAERKALSGYGGALATSMYGRGVRVGASGSAFMRGRPGRAGGFIPNFANPNTERAAAAAGGYTAGAIKTMRQPGAGTMMYNSAETVKQFPGMSQKAIMPPKGSPAGAAYKSAFGAAHGFNPYAAGGFVPNFNKSARTRKPKTSVYDSPAFAHRYDIDASDIGVLLALAGGEVKATDDFSAQAKSLVGLKKADPTLYKNLVNEEARIMLRNVRIESFINTKNEEDAAKMFDRTTRKHLSGGMGNLANDIMDRFSIPGTPGRMGKLTAGLEGEVFEESMRMAMKAAAAIPGADFDFEAGRPPSAALQKIFGQPIFRIDAKRRIQSARKGEMPKKYFNDPQTSKEGVFMIKAIRNNLLGKGKAKALGFVPNFSPLSSALGREMAAGVPASAIRVGSSPSLRGAGNPRGLGVYNTVDEPMGLNQGINRSKSMGIDPRMHGAAGGFVPNFMVPSRILNQPRPLGPYRPAGSSKSKKAEAADVDTAKNTSRMADLMEKHGTAISIGGFAAYSAAAGGFASSESKNVQAYGGIATNALMMGATGAAIGAPFGGVGAVPGAAIGAGIGAVVGVATSFREIMMLMDDGTKEFNEKLAKQVSVINENINQLVDGLGKLANFDAMTPEERVTELTKLERKRSETLAELDSRDEPIFKSMAADLRKNVPSAGTLLAGGVPDAKTLMVQQEKLNKFAAEKEAAAIYSSMMKGFNSESLMKTTVTGGNAMSVGGTMGGYLNPNNLQVSTSAAPGADLKAQKFMSSLLTPEIMAKVLTGKLNVRRPDARGVMQDTEITGLQRLQEIRNLQPSNQPAAFGRLLQDSGFEALGGAFRRDFDPRSHELSGKQQMGRQFAYDSMFTGAGPLNPDMLQAYTTAVKRPDVAPPKSMMPTIREAARQNQAMKEFAQNLKFANGEFGKELAHQRKLNTLQNQYGEALSRATKDPRGQAYDQFSRTMSDARFERVNAEVALKAARTQQVTAGLAGLDAAGFIAKNYSDAATGDAAFAKFREMTSGSFSPERIQKMRDRQTELLDPSKAGALSATEMMEAEFLPKLIGIFEGADRKYEEGATSVTQAFNRTKEAAEEERDVKLKTIELQYTLNESMRDFNREIAASIKNAELAEAKRLASSGRLGARGVASAYQSAIDAQILDKGIGSINTSDVLGQTFRNEMAYNQVDAFQDFRKGVKDVAGTMKSSFAEAFQSISTGATTVQGALANMAQSILNSINQMSSQIFANMMFAKMFPGQATGTPTAAHGGYIPGYAGGGLVTGGSGYKDDVLTKMSGGEFVIKKSAVNKIGVGTLNAINGYANGGQTGQSGGGPGMGAMGALALGSGALMGIMGAASADRPEKYRGRDYGLGRGALGPLGGADRDAGRVDSIGGGGTSANVSLAKGFVYYRRDPKTGKLISERARPTEGRFEVSDSLSLMGRLAESDPQTARMFDKEQRLGTYINQIQDEKASRKAQIQAVKDQKRSRTIGAFMNAGMLIGGAKLFEKFGNTSSPDPDPGFDNSKDSMEKLAGGNANGGLAKVMGGEYIMSPQAVRTHGVGFMTELNRGNVPGYASGGLVGGAVGGGGGSTLNTGGNTTNNVKININIDKSGGAEAEVGVGSGSGKGKSEGTEENEEIQNNAKFGEMLKGVVLEEIVKQQRPGGLLSDQN